MDGPTLGVEGEILHLGHIHEIHKKMTAVLPPMQNMRIYM